MEHERILIDPNLTQEEIDEIMGLPSGQAPINLLPPDAGDGVSVLTSYTLLSRKTGIPVKQLMADDGLFGEIDETLFQGYIDAEGQQHHVGNFNYVESFNNRDAALLKHTLESCNFHYEVVHKQYGSPGDGDGLWAIQFFIEPKQNAIVQGIEFQKMQEFLKAMAEDGDTETVRILDEYAKEFADVLKQEHGAVQPAPVG